MDSIAQLIIQVGVGGAMAVGILWGFRHLLTSTFPQMLSDFREELKEERATRRAVAAEFSASLRMLAESWDQREKEFREWLHEELKMQRESIEKLNRSLNKRDQS